METTIKELENQFYGTGEVSDFKYRKLESNSSGFLYEVILDNKIVCYEVFNRKITPVCIDFEKRIYSKTEFKVIYPKSKDFGIWAWSYMKYDSAFEKFNSLKNE